MYTLIILLFGVTGSRVSLPLPRCLHRRLRPGRVPCLRSVQDYEGRLEQVRQRSAQKVVAVRIGTREEKSLWEVIEELKKICVQNMSHRNVVSFVSE